MIILSQDGIKTLEKLYKVGQIYESGQIVRDISLVWPKLTDWIGVIEADLIIPYVYSRPKKYPIGARIWILSQQPENSYYKGNYFDLEVADTKKRVRRLKCKLSKTAIEFVKKIKKELDN